MNVEPGSDMVLYISLLIALVIILVLAWLANWIAKKILTGIITRIVRKSENKYDDIFLEKGVFNRLSHLAPVAVLSIGIAIFFPANSYGPINILIIGIVQAYLYIIVGLVVAAFADALGAVGESLDPEGKRQTKSYVQAFKLVVWMVVAILAVSAILGRSPGLLLSSLGALTAILLLIFKDTILGLVAGIQLSFNNMVAKGDWITVPHAHADGDVIDVTLTTIKVQNWNKTISHIPIYSLVSNAFTNWRGMSESGGRRIKRALNIDMTSVKFLNRAQIEKLSEIRLLKPYLDQKQTELAEHRSKLGLSEEDPRNSRHLTNLGTFRAYIACYLRDNPMVHEEMTFLVRYLELSTEGLPVEIYVFSKDQAWANYEAIQADILDHLLAILPEFGLRIFQKPSGQDFAGLRFPGND